MLSSSVLQKQSGTSHQDLSGDSILVADSLLPPPQFSIPDELHYRHSTAGIEDALIGHICEMCCSLPFLVDYARILGAGSPPQTDTKLAGT